MTIDELVKNIPETAKDIRLNFMKLWEAPESLPLIYAVVISLTPSETTKQLILLLETELDESIIRAAHMASGIMSMNNIYYRFLHLSDDKIMATMNPGLRMQGMKQHGISENVFELMSLAISVLNGCGMCIQSHMQVLKKQEVDLATIQLSAKVAAVINAFNQVTTRSIG